MSFDQDGQNDFGVENGTNNVVEVEVAGYDNKYNNCSDKVVSGDTPTCTITINDQHGTLTLITDVVKDNGGTAIASDFTINVTGTNINPPPPFAGTESPGTIITMDAGSYSVSVDPVTGYLVSFSTDCSGTIGIGDEIICNITIDDVPPILTVIKDPTNNNGGSAAPDEFQLTVDALPVISGVTSEYPIDTPLAIDETQIIGYTFVEITGSEKCPTALGGTITLSLGDDITCTIVNDDIPAIKVDPTADLVTDENGTKDTFTVVLTTIPTDEVTIAVSSSLPSEGTVDPIELNFTDGNWNTPQTVTVTGINDLVADGDIPYLITLDPSSSIATEYAALTPVGITATNFDNDTAGYIITPTEDLQTTEGGGSQKVQISLRSKPVSLVSLEINSLDPTEGIVSPISIIFDPSTWPPDDPEEIIITGKDDTLTDGPIDYSVTMTATSADPDYSGPVAELTVTNHDAPTIEWIKPIKPVSEDDYYEVKNFDPILLEVKSVGSEPISKVRFYRYVGNVKDWITIGEDITPPYQEILDPTELDIGWNEIRAFAFGPVPSIPGEIQTFSSHPWIFILRELKYQIFLPSISKAQ
jgi:hypothetical protein